MPAPPLPVFTPKGNAGKLLPQGVGLGAKAPYWRLLVFAKAPSLILMVQTKATMAASPLLRGKFMTCFSLLLCSLGVYAWVTTPPPAAGHKTLSSGLPPEGYTGANGQYCNSCHSTNNLNTEGGSIMVNGLPTTSYEPGKTYTFSITITHAQPNRSKWGFSIIALNKAGARAGSFGSTSANAIINGEELSHADAPATSLQASYTFSELSYTAPTQPGPDDETISFYYVANAANGNGSTSGDFIYAATHNASLALVYTFTGNGLWSNPANWAGQNPPPAVLQGSGEIKINPSPGGQCLLTQPQTMGPGTRLTLAPNAQLVLQGGLLIQQQ